MRPWQSLAAALILVLLWAGVSPVSAQGFVGPANGGGWSGTVSGTNLVYNGVAYPIVNGRVKFPDCTTYIVAPNGALLGGAVTPDCTVGTAPTVTWATPAPVTAGTALSATQLNATANVAGTFAYAPPAGTVMSVPGTQTLSATFTPTDTAKYTTATRTVTLQVSTGAFVGPVNGGGWSGTVSGTNLVYNGVAYPIVNGRVKFPDCTTYIVAPNGALLGGAVTPNCTVGTAPTVTWAAPAPVTVGTALSATQLNATANVAGTFAYAPPAGTVMSVAGTQTLSTTFTPSDTAKYTTATRTVTLQVSAGAFAGPVNGGGWTGTISGTNLVYNGVAYPIINGRVNFPDCTTYIVAPNGALLGGAVTPNCTVGPKAAPTVTWAAPAPVTAGMALSAAQLNATANVAGTFAYAPPAGTVMNAAGTQTLSTTFTPTDTAKYTTATRTVTLQVNAVPSAFVGPASGGGWTGTVSGANLVYNGVAYPIVNGRVNFPDCTTYIVAPNGALLGGTVTPNCSVGPKTAPTVTWATPAPVTAGTALSAAQLNATANVAGTFAYAPPAGTVMRAAGTQTLSTTFTPTDTAKYTTATRTVTLQVSAAPGAFVGPANGGGWSGTVSGTNLVYNGVAYPIVNGEVDFPDCTTYIVAPNGALSGGSVTPTCGGNPSAPTSDGKVVGTKVVLQSGGPAIWAFDAAYDAGSGRYLVVGYWGDAVWGQYIGRDGGLVGSRFVIAPVGAYNPRVTANGDGVFAVVYTAVYNTYSLEMRLVEVAPRAWPASAGVSPPAVIKANADYSLTYRTGIGWNPVLQQFLVAWSQNVSGRVGVWVSGFRANATAGLAATLAADGMACGSTGVFAKRALSEVAVAPDGTTMVVGYTDTTDNACGVYGGLWYRALAPTGLPIGSAGVVHGTPDPTLHREQRVVYSPVLSRFVVAWNRSSGVMRHTIYAQKLTRGGARDGDAYVVRAPILNNPDPTDDGFGQVGMAYDQAADQFELAVRGTDVGGLAPLWRFRLGSDAVAKNMSPVRVDSATAKPDAAVVADTTGNFLIVYRLDFARIAATLITP